MFRVLAFVAFGAAVVLAILFGRTEDPAAQRSLGGGFALCLGLALGAFVQAGVVEGRIRGASRKVARADHPAAFWGIVVVEATVALVLLVAGAWYLVT